ncbi:DUF1638 domain-containing protein [Chloroflexota bacterium]
MTASPPIQIKRIIACEVFRPALEALNIEAGYAHVRVTYLPSTLHSNSSELKRRLTDELAAASAKNEKAVFLYGACFPHIDDLCQEKGAARAPGDFCYEILLNHKRFKRFMDETAGTYFAEKDLILNFDDFCRIPLELDDEDMRKYFFGPYKRFLYIRQPFDPDLVLKAGEIAEYLDLNLEVHDADYSYLQKILDELL